MKGARGNLYMLENIMTQRTIVCLAAASFLGATLAVTEVAPAHSQPGVGPISVNAQPFDPATMRVVSYADLDLRNQAGRRSFEYRIEAAAHQLCPDDIAVGGPLDLTAKRCFNQTMWTAQRTMQNAIAQAQQTGATAMNGSATAMTIAIVASR